MRLFSKAIFATAALVALPSLGAADTCPSFAQPGSALSYDSDTVYTAQSHDMFAGGNIQLNDCADVPGYGFIIEQPDYTLQYDAQGRGRALEFRVEADCDAVLLVNSADAAWHFNDDDSTDDGALMLDPRLRLADAPSGRYDIWVGTIGTDTCEARLFIESW